MSEGCSSGIYMALALTSLGLVISISLNAIFYWQRLRYRQDAGRSEHAVPYNREDFSIEGRNLQDNAIYGNINTDGPSGSHTEMLYEQMTTRVTRDPKPTLPTNPEVSYASLDLIGGNKNRKKRKGNQAQPKRLAHAHSQQEFRELDFDCGLPPRQSSPMASRNSIYLNSHQVALQSQEQEWERQQERQEMEMEVDIEAIHEDPARFKTRANQSQAFEVES